ncbi:uncharacterized protein LOC133306226 [Gastrolobium bilobum]|uniref:uncharacterized protein LOC133306226 n=1 Tax=Gastrolobium bilobum TaxID=150636 RepID=UPI002AB033D7|nr:uncharacterized protein LOC133306226 [Gastrolobium bilobum]
MASPQSSPRSSTSSKNAKSVKLIMKSFSNPIADKLDEDSFLPWEQLALASIHGHNLQDHLSEEKIPTRFSTQEDKDREKESEGYATCHQQDHLLVSWLLSSMNISFKNRMVGCKFAHEIWTRLQVYFASHTQAKVKQLKNQLKNIKKKGPASDYLLQIKKIIDSLGAVGSPLTDAEYSEAILDGLSEEYTRLITFAMSRSPPFSII